MATWAEMQALEDKHRAGRSRRENVTWKMIKRLVDAGRITRSRPDVGLDPTESRQVTQHKIRRQQFQQMTDMYSAELRKVRRRLAAVHTVRAWRAFVEKHSPTGAYQP